MQWVPLPSLSVQSSFRPLLVVGVISQQSLTWLFCLTELISSTACDCDRLWNQFQFTFLLFSLVLFFFPLQLIAQRYEVVERQRRDGGRLVGRQHQSGWPHASGTGNADQVSLCKFQHAHSAPAPGPKSLRGVCIFFVVVLCVHEDAVRDNCCLSVWGGLCVRMNETERWRGKLYDINYSVHSWFTAKKKLRRGELCVSPLQWTPWTQLDSHPSSHSALLPLSSTSSSRVSSWAVMYAHDNGGECIHWGFERGRTFAFRVKKKPEESFKQQINSSKLHISTGIGNLVEITLNNIKDRRQ